MSVSLLLGGGLGLRTLLFIHKNFEIHSVLTDYKSKEIQKFCYEQNIDLFVGNPRTKKIEDFIRDRITPDIVFSINYKFLVDERIIQWPKKFCLNIHGSLLPLYRGRAPLIWAIINGEMVSGITIHLIDEGCDTGCILMQEQVEIPPTSTGMDMVNLYESLYPKLVSQVLKKIERDESLSFTTQDESKATYFPKRSPEDGEIDWGWHKERLYNWVRALAPPYPGAFSFIGSNKVFIDKVSYSDAGFDYREFNGKILESDYGQVFVKTPNGVIKAYLRDKELLLEKGKVFGRL